MRKGIKMNLEELSKLVDEAGKIKDTIDELEEKLKKIKSTFCKEAKARKRNHFLGKKRFVRVDPLTITSCPPKELEQTFAEMGRREEYYDCVKVKVTEAKAALGETIFGDISSSDSIPYKKVVILKTIPKKYKE